MEFKRLHNIETPLFKSFWESYEETFPYEERRNSEDQKNILKNGHYRLSAITEGDKVLGFISFWKFSDFTFLEHYIILKQFCGNGHGSKALKKFIFEAQSNIILEVEKPDNEISIRRIQFYQRNGFHLNMHHYIQPSYGPGKKWLPLVLMSFPHLIDENTFIQRKAILYKEVYQVK